MAKINQLQFEARVLTEPRTKQFPSGKQVTDWLVGLYAGKNQDGTYKKASITVKHWGNTIPQKGKDIVMHGKLEAEAWSHEGRDITKPVINCESWHEVGQQPSAPAPQQGAEEQDLPF